MLMYPFEIKQVIWLQNCAWITEYLSCFFHMQLDNVGKSGWSQNWVTFHFIQWSSGSKQNLRNTDVPTCKYRRTLHLHTMAILQRISPTRQSFICKLNADISATSEAYWSRASESSALLPLTQTPCWAHLQAQPPPAILTAPPAPPAPPLASAVPLNCPFHSFLECISEVCPSLETHVSTLLYSQER